MNTNESFEKTRKKNGFEGAHPKSARMQIAQQLKDPEPRPHPAAKRHLMTADLESLLYVLDITLRARHIGNVAIEHVELKGKKLHIQIAYFNALDRVFDADVVGTMDGGALQVVSLEAGPKCRVLWHRPSALGLMPCQTQPGDGYD